MRKLFPSMALGLLTWGGAAASAGEAPPALQAARELYQRGLFAEAGSAAGRLLEANPRNYDAALLAGQTALLANRLRAAEGHLARASELKPGEAAPKALLAEALYRQDLFARAAPLARQAGKTALAAKLESFGSTAPNRIEGPPGPVALGFVATDPLPLVELSIDGKPPALFVIDTGGGELILDSDYAREISVPVLDEQLGTFAGGKQAPIRHGRIGSVALGAFTVRDVPIMVLPTRAFGAMFPGKRVDGILGTVLLYHFLPTLDLAGGRLVLERRSPQAAARLDGEVASGRLLAVPMWLQGDHYLVARGTVNRAPETMLFIDTGLAGGGFTCPASTLAAAGIELERGQEAEGLGGGGKVSVIPFVVDSLSLGPAREERVQGLFTGGFPVEDALGFHIGGLISHGFFRPYAVTFDFDGMRLLLRRTAR